MFTPGRSAFNLTSGVRSAKGRILSRAAATCAAPGSDRTLEVNDLSNTGRARLLEDMMCRRQILRRDAQRLVKRHIEGRPPADLRAVGHLADLAQDMFRRDGAGLQRAQILTTLVHRGVAAVD